MRVVCLCIAGHLLYFTFALWLILWLPELILLAWLRLGIDFVLGFEFMLFESCYLDLVFRCCGFGCLCDACLTRFGSGFLVDCDYCCLRIWVWLLSFALVV